MGLVAKAFQDIITFSRASSGTYVNSNGYITNSAVLNYLTYSNQPENAAWTKSNSFVQQNLIFYSEQFENAFWASSGSITTAVVANTAISPIGTLTADTATFNVTTPIVRSQPSALITNGTPYTLSVWVRASSSGGAANVRLTVNNAASWTGALSNKVALTSEWQRISLTWTSIATTLYFIIGASDNTGAVDATCYGNVDVWGAQLVQGSVPGDYRATTTAALPCLYADYNGALRARKLCEDATASVAHRVLQAQTTSTISSLSVVAKAAERTWVYVRFTDSASVSKYAWFNLATGTLGTVGSGMTGSIQSAGNGYYRCTLSGPAFVGSNNCIIGATTADGLDSYTGDGSSGIYIADAQLNDGSSALSYYDTTASAYNAPRFDYDPVTLAAKGLLVEESRANLLLQSSDYATSWTASRATVTSNAALSPDGTATADKLVATAVLGTHRVYQSGITNSGTTTRTLSAYFKTAEYSYAGLMLSDATESDQVRVQWNLATGASTVAPVGTTITLVSSSMQNLSNGWVRCIMTCTVDASEPIFSAWLFVVDNANASSFTGDGVSGVYAWGAQCETGAFATSYIPTTASQVTRAADVASVNTLSPWFNQVGGTLYFEGVTTAPVDTTVRNAVSINDGTIANMHRIFSYNGKIGGSTTTGASTVADLQPLTYTSAATFKFAYAYAANDFAAVGNGGAPLTDTLGTLPAGLSVMNIGNPSFHWGFWIRRITYYPRRLTNAELQTLTTL